MNQKTKQCKLRTLKKGNKVVVVLGHNAKVPPHKHVYYEFVYVADGMAYHIVNGQRHVIYKGMYFLLTPSDVHEYIPINSNTFSIYNVCFSPSVLDSAFNANTPIETVMKHPSINVHSKKNFITNSFRHFYCADDTILNLAQTAHKEYNDKLSSYSNMLKYIIRMLLIKMFRNAEDALSEAPTKSFVTEIIQYVNEHYAEELTLTSICKKIGYNAQYASRAFKEETGINFITHLQNVRIEKACALLLATDMSIVQIANKVGYNNIAYFYRIFKNSIGESPQNYRTK